MESESPSSQVSSSKLASELLISSQQAKLAVSALYSVIVSKKLTRTHLFKKGGGNVKGKGEPVIAGGENPLKKDFFKKEGKKREKW